MIYNGIYTTDMRFYNKSTKATQLYSNFVNIHFLRSFFLILVLLMSFSCSSSKAGNEPLSNSAETKDSVISVSTGKTVSQQVPSFIQTTGSFVADESSNVASKVAGKVSNVYVNVGQFVSQGTTIIRLDDIDAKLRLNEAQVGVKQAEAAIRQAEARLGLAQNGKFNSSTIPEVRAASANLEQLEAELRQAETNEKRYRELVESGDVAMITYEQFRTQRDTAQARVNSAKEQLNTAVNLAKQNNEAIRSAQANLEGAKAQVATAQQAITDLVVKAPFSGFVSERPVSVGEFVTTSTPILVLLRVNPIKLQIQVNESDVSQLAIGRGVSVEVDAYKERKFSGTVSAINPALDVASRAATIEALIENGDNALRTGMFATVRIVRSGVNTGIFTPKSSVLRDDATQNYRIFVIEEGIAKLKVVQLGTEEGEMVQILSGVDADQVVATSNLKQLYEGAKVQVQ